MTRRGKIARLPCGIREELNQRLENGEQGGRVIEWLNGLPEVVAILKQDFEGQPISDANLTQWRQGGFRDWQAVRKAEEMMARWRIEDGSLGAGDGMANGQSQMAENGATSGAVAGVLTERLMVHYAAALEDAIGEPNDQARKVVQQFGQSLQDVVRVRRFELSRENVEISREWLAIERERLELERARTQVRGANGERDDAERERLSHLEKAEMVKQMVRDARASLEGNSK